EKYAFLFGQTLCWIYFPGEEITLALAFAFRSK
ncbi:unnamed protein product, partial [marine sediment metagenome]